MQPHPSVRTQGIYTILRDQSTSREDFIFFVDRLSTYLIEKALEFLPCKPLSVTTPVGATYNGLQFGEEVGYRSQSSRKGPELKPLL